LASLAGLALAGGGVQTAAFFAQVHLPPVVVPQTVVVQQASFAAGFGAGFALRVLAFGAGVSAAVGALLSLEGLAAGVSAAMARAALKDSAAIMVRIRVFMVGRWRGRLEFKFKDGIQIMIGDKFMFGSLVLSWWFELNLRL